MFSGIVTEIGQVSGLQETDDGTRVSIRASMFADPADPCYLGQSIAVSGVCLTITEITNDSCSFDLSSETLRRTTLGALRGGSSVNLEKCLRLADRLDGHLVLGHVDAVAEIVSRTVEQNTVRFEVSLPVELRPFIAPKGSVAVDGVSLTVGECSEERFAVYIVPHTLHATILDQWTSGTKVNLEVDCLARYAVQAVQASLPGLVKSEFGR